ncbi:MAG: response regulator [PVC group bacterium]
MNQDNRREVTPTDESRDAIGEELSPRRLKSGKTILVVEDEPLNRQVITRYFGLLGYRVLQADRGDEGLRLALEESPDAIILDNQLPGLDGIDICRRLREENRQTPVMLMSAYDLPLAERKRALDLGIRGFLRKPFAFQHLKAVLRFTMKKPRFGFRRSKLYYRKPHFSLTSRTLANQVFQTVFREGLDSAGHVHFQVRGHPDHLILLCSRKVLGKVVAKSPVCGQGECIPWDRSSFSGYRQDRVLKDLSQEINLVRIDAADYQMSWPTLADFICWLEMSY